MDLVFPVVKQDTCPTGSLWRLPREDLPSRSRTRRQLDRQTKNVRPLCQRCRRRRRNLRRSRTGLLRTTSLEEWLEQSSLRQAVHGYLAKCCPRGILLGHRARHVRAKNRALVTQERTGSGSNIVLLMRRTITHGLMAWSLCMALGFFQRRH